MCKITESATFQNLREQKKEECRRSILHAARDLFDEKGFHNTTMTEIAKAAHISPASVFNYFPSKTDLLTGVHYMKAQDFAAIMAEQNTSGESSVQKLLQLFDSHLIDIFQYPRLSFEIYEFLAFDLIPSTAQKELFDDVEMLIRSAILDGELKQDTDIDLITNVFFGLGFTGYAKGNSIDSCSAAFTRLLKFYYTEK